MSDNGNTLLREVSAKNFSKQPRFDAKSTLTDFLSSFNWHYNQDSDKEPKYELNSSKRDIYLLNQGDKNPNLSGMLNSVIDIDKNRGWRLVGGRNQVYRFTDIFHHFQTAPGIYGWRSSISFSSRSFWNTNLGFVVELGRDGRNGPIRELYTVDPTNCKLTGNVKTPLEYTNAKTKTKRYWRTADFFRGVSNISTNEKLHGLGRCAVDRALTLSKLMMALYEHDFEAMGARAPRGLLLLQGISEQSWTKAMEARDAKLDAVGYEFYGALAVLASASKTVDAKLVGLSELPKGFNMREFMDMLMYGLALCFGYDPSEFWPVQFGALGRGTEMEVQHEKATGKGRLDFPLTFQEPLQEFLPDSLEFMFDQRDEKGDLLHASVNQSWVTVVTSMSKEGLVSVEEARVLLADYGVLPRSWAPTDTASQTDLDEIDAEEPVDSDSEKEPIPSEPEDMQARVQTKRLKLLKDDLKERPYIWRCAERFPKEPIVQYSYPANTMIMLWERAEEILERSVWQGINIE
jgi:hypothetical protein